MGERIINIRDLIIEILLHWRGIILWMCIGGFILGILSRTAFLRSSAAADAQQEQLTVLDLQDEMPQKELAEVEQVLLNDESVDKWNSYIENSALMGLDSSRVYQEELIYVIMMEEMRPELIGTYANLLTVNEMYQSVADRTKDFTASDIQELLNVINVGTALNQKNNSFNITILAGTEEDCTRIAKAVKSYIDEIHASIEEIYGTHELVLLQENIVSMNNISLLQKQIDIRDKVISLQTEMKMHKELFSEKQKQYYRLRKKEKKADSAGQKNADNGDLAEEVGSTSVTGIPDGMPAFLKNAVWGMFFAVLIYVLVIFFHYILDDRLRYTDNCTTIYHVPSLGHIPAERTARVPFGQIDRKLYFLRDKRRYTSSVEEALRLSAASIAMVLQRKGISLICGVGSQSSAGTMEEIGAILEAGGINFQNVENILYSADSLHLLSSVQAAVLVEKAGAISYGEIWQELEILRQQGIDILGMIIVE